MVTETVRVGSVGGLTVNVKEVVWESEPAVPVTVIGVEPVGVLPVVVIVRVELWVGVTGFVAKLHEAPVGRPLQAKETACVVPLSKVAVIVFVPDPPWVTAIPPELLRLKSKLPDVELSVIGAMAVDQFWNVESTRYSPPTQKVEVEKSVPAPK